MNITTVETGEEDNTSSDSSRGASRCFAWERREERRWRCMRSLMMSAKAGAPGRHAAKRLVKGAAYRRHEERARERAA